VLVYLDDNHPRASYSTSMAALLGDATVAALGGPYIGSMGQRSHQPGPMGHRSKI
jgi:hypothetical protein